MLAISQGQPTSCVAALILQAGYIPSILAHYRIEFGSDRRDMPTEKANPLSASSFS